jgi:HAD superfamily hydrolase (TIGR01509 family)
VSSELTPTPTPLAVSFDFGQTLFDLDTEMLSRRLGERRIDVPAERIEAAVPEAWAAYDAAIHRGLGGHPWKILMGRLLVLAGVPEAEITGAVDWLWSEQPRKNLWRRPIPGMGEIVDELRSVGVPVGVISNSEGFLAELIDEIGWSARLPIVADSGKLAMEKPASPIFRWAAEALGVDVTRVVHVGDSFAADVEGAVAAGMQAVWFRGKPGRALPAGVLVAADAASVRAALRGLGITALSGEG